MLRLNSVVVLLSAFALIGCSKDDPGAGKEIKSIRKMQDKPMSRQDVQNLKPLPKKEQ